MKPHVSPQAAGQQPPPTCLASQGRVPAAWPWPPDLRRRAAVLGWLAGALAGLGSPRLLAQTKGRAAGGSESGRASAEASHSRVELLAARGDLAAREALWLALRITPRRGWHSYWLNPGDAGVAPSLTLNAAVQAAGFRLGPIQWPAPQRIPVKQLASYGYDGEIVLPLLLFAPARLPPAAPGAAADAAIELRLAANWLVCDESCIAQDAELSLRLTPRRAADTAPRADHAGLASRAADQAPARAAIAAALQRVPAPAPASVGAQARRIAPGPAVPAGRPAASSAASALEVRIDGLPAAMHGRPGELFFEREEIVEPGPAPRLDWLPRTDRGTASARWSTTLGAQGKTLAPGTRLDAVWVSAAAGQRALRLAVLVQN